MNYKKTLKKVLKQLKKENSKKTENRLIVVKNALKQIIREEYMFVNKFVKDVFTMDKAEELLKEATLIDINGQEHKVGLISVSNKSMYISLCDPGNWVDSEDIDEDILTKESLLHIEKEIQKIIPNSTVRKGETHLADVEFIIDVEGV